MTGEIRTDIPAEDIPRFPVLRLVWHTDGTATLEGAPVDVPAGADARTSALSACAERARERGGDPAVIRVMAVEEASGTSWPMGVTGDGDIVELESPADAAASARKVPRRGLLAAGAIGAAALLGGGGIGVATLLARSRKPVTPTGPTTPPGQADLVPVAVPQGYSATALWSVPVAQGTHALGLRDGRTLTVAPDTGNLRAHHPTTGHVTWTGTGSSPGWTVAETVIDGRPFLLSLPHEGALTLWPLDQGPTIGGTELKLPARDGTLHVSGPSPAVALPTQVGYIFVGADSAQFDIPVGYTLIGATAKGQAVLLGQRDWALLTPGQTAAQPTPLLLPSADHVIAGGFMLGDKRLLVRVDGSGQSQWSLYATDASNAMLSVPAKSTQLPHPKDLRWTPDRSVWAIDGLIATEDSLTPAENARIQTVTGLGVYAKNTTGQVLLKAGHDDATALPKDVTAPDIADHSHAVLVATKLDTPTAYTVGASS